MLLLPELAPENTQTTTSDIELIIWGFISFIVQMFTQLSQAQGYYRGLLLTIEVIAQL